MNVQFGKITVMMAPVVKEMRLVPPTAPARDAFLKEMGYHDSVLQQPAHPKRPLEKRYGLEPLPQGRRLILTNDDEGQDIVEFSRYCRENDVKLSDHQKPADSPDSKTETVLDGDTFFPAIKQRNKDFIEVQKKAGRTIYYMYTDTVKEGWQGPSAKRTQFTHWTHPLAMVGMQSPVWTRQQHEQYKKLHGHYLNGFTPKKHWAKLAT